MSEELPDMPPSIDEPRWPKFLGYLGMALGILMSLDKLDELVLPLIWSEDRWTP